MLFRSSFFKVARTPAKQNLFYVTALCGRRTQSQQMQSTFTMVRKISVSGWQSHLKVWLTMDAGHHLVAAARHLMAAADHLQPPDKHDAYVAGYV